MLEAAESNRTVAGNEWRQCVVCEDRDAAVDDGSVAVKANVGQDDRGARSSKAGDAVGMVVVMVAYDHVREVLKQRAKC